jgi:hypothetical protein
MFKPKAITCLGDCTTGAWTIQSFGYDNAHDAKMAAAKVFTIKSGAMVKPHKGKWAVFFHDQPNFRHAD